MDKPIILAVDDEPAVLAAVARDLRKEFGSSYRILRADSGIAALETLRALKLKAEPIALLVADQRMPGMNGVEMLREAIQLYPDVKRVLLTAYADTEAAIRAINEVGLNHYLQKPWSPPEEHLYPVLRDLLEDWLVKYQPPYEGIRVVGQPWTLDGHHIRDFLARNLIPFSWCDLESEEATQLLRLAGADVGTLPIVVFPDGSFLVRPSTAELAAKIGWDTEAQEKAYDLIIVGGGPAGLAAGVYGASEGLSTLIVESDAPGGQAGQSSRIENYLGFPVGLSGGDLARRAVAQATRFGAEILRSRTATGLRIKDNYRILELDNGSEVSGQSLLIATGVAYRMLDLPGAERLTGAGVYYGAAITEAMASKDADVAIVGGGNSAGQAAIYLSKYARSVTILVRNASLASSMSSYLIAQIAATPKIVVREEVALVALEGERSLERIAIRPLTGREAEKLAVTALFVFIGATPRTDWLGEEVERDPQGYVLTGRDVMHGGKRPRGWNVARDPLWLETSVPGIFVAGDVRHRSVKRIASAVGEGAMAVQFIHQHLSGALLTHPSAAVVVAPSRTGSVGRTAPAAGPPRVSTSSQRP